ncbi:MAG: NAD-dependent epimerase/dehydratase family protein [Acidimicrobiales bacterium]
MKVLVTGATSLLGRHTVHQLLDAGHEVTTLQRGPDNSSAQSITGSVTDAAVVAAAMDGHDSVIHLAAKVAATGSWADFESVNVDGTRTVITSAAEAGVTRMVFVSSPSVAHSGDPIVGGGASPADPDTTIGHYSTTKAMAERCALAASTDTLPIVAIRPHLVIGPGDTQLIGRVVDRARAARLPLIGSGLALVDTTWVDNAAAALVAALDRAPDLGGTAYVVSNGQPRTVHELFSRITAAAGINWSAQHIPAGAAVAGGRVVDRIWARTERTEDPPMTAFGAEQLSTAHWFDQRETRRALGWEPAVSLAEGFDQLTDWFAAQA